jgi:predicted nucleotide-binding protein (sugar kinase/HSP70/actin superfamily)
MKISSRMALWKKILLGIALFAAASFGFMTWYAIHYSMERAREFEVNSRVTGSKILIATQGSAFKDAIVAGVIAHLKPREVYVRVIDVSNLSTVEESDWNAIVVIHTWQMHEPQPAAKRFIDRAQNLQKVIVLSTSGAGTFKIEGIDAISSASEMVDVPQRIAEIDTRIDALLGSARQTPAPPRDSP